MVSARAAVDDIMSGSASLLGCAGGRNAAVKLVVRVTRTVACGGVCECMCARVCKHGIVNGCFLVRVR